MAKVRITKELDSRNMQYFKLTKKRGKITDREAFEAMEESYYFGEYLIRFNVPEEAPMDLYEDGDEWRLYAVKELLEEEIYKTHQEGYEECKKDFNFEKTANNGWIPCNERLPEEGVPVNITYKNSNPPSYYSNIKNIPFTATAISYKNKWYWYSCICLDILNEYGKNEADAVNKDIDIIAWQPLPEPYREEQEDEQ